MTRPAAAPARVAGKVALTRALLHPAAKPLIFVVSLLPLAWLFYGAVANKLGCQCSLMVSARPMP